jgi:hypothetical protein
LPSAAAPSLSLLHLPSVFFFSPHHAQLRSLISVLLPASQIAELEEKLRREKEKRRQVEAKLKSLSEDDESSAI